jgi:hypothetical protein
LAGRRIRPTRRIGLSRPTAGQDMYQKQRKIEIRSPSGGNDLRQTFRTIATGAGVSKLDTDLLMNHAVPRANAGYITRQKLLEDHLHGQQQAISGSTFAALRTTVADDQPLLDWLECSAIRHAILATPKMDNENGGEGTARWGRLAKGPLPDRASALHSAYPTPRQRNQDPLNKRIKSMTVLNLLPPFPH